MSNSPMFMEGDLMPALSELDRTLGLLKEWVERSYWIRGNMDTGEFCVFCSQPNKLGPKDAPDLGVTHKDDCLVARSKKQLQRMAP